MNYCLTHVLRFFNTELGWNQSKVDDLLLPIIQKMNKRTQVMLPIRTVVILVRLILILLSHPQQGAMNKQGNLLGFLGVPAGGAATRKRQAYSSKRLQQVVADFRKKQAANGTGGSPNVSQPGTSSESRSEDDEVEERPKKRKKTSVEGTAAPTSTRGTGIAKRGARGGRGSGRGRGAKSRVGVKSNGGRKGKKTATSGSPSDSEIEDAFNEPEQSGTPPPPLNVNLRPRPKPRPLVKPIATEEDSEQGGMDNDA